MGLQPGNPIVGGTVLRIPAIQSPDYVPGVSGWIVRIDGSAEFNNLSIRGEFTGTDFVMNSAGLFFYSGTPAMGNLILSLAPAGGTDDEGNVFPAGIRIYNAAASMPAMANGWSVGGHASYALDPLGNLVVSWQNLLPGTVADGTTIWAPGSLPGAEDPPTNRRIACYTDSLKVSGAFAEGAALEIRPDGSVECYGISTAATRADLFAVIPLAF